MRISYNWLKNYIDLDITAEEAAEVLTDIGLEVEDIEEITGKGGGMAGLTVGLVLEAEKHPDADKLKITKVDVGNGEPLQIVCGAPNVAAGQKVVVATVGSTLYPLAGEKFQIKKAKIRGVESFGMICAEDEIGVGESHDGIIVLPENTTIGTAVKDLYNVQSDYIIEIGLTANRSDATGHIGVARDLAAALTIRKNKTYSVKYPELKPIDNSTESEVCVTVESKELCPRYSGILLKNIQVKPSPEWLQNYLTHVGLRPINNVVDITNFILLEYGQPLHAFDAAKIKGNKIIVKTVAENTPFVTLDGTERKLAATDLMICNENEPMCIAGVMVGLHSGVSETTTEIFLESATFNPVSVRKTANRLNLRTDSAQRFEKGTDPNFTTIALERAVGLLQELAGATVASRLVDFYPETLAPYAVYLPYKKLDTLIGFSIERNTVKQILQSLEIKIVSENNEGLQLEVPLFKADVQRDVDVIEEVLRIYGYNQIPFPEQFKSSLAHKPAIDKEAWKERIANYLASNGFNEMLNNSLVNNKYAEYGIDFSNSVKLLKSSNAELDVMRTTLLVSGLETIAYNHNRRNTDLKLFELGRSYHTKENGFEESEHLAIYVTGNLAAENWKSKQAVSDIYFLKGIVFNILKQCGIEKYEVTEATSSELNYGLQISAEKKVLATLGSVSAAILKKFDIDGEVWYADIAWENLLASLNNKTLKFREISKYPWVRRDLALLLDKTVNFEQVEKIANREIKKVLKSVNLFDIYEDKKLGDNKKSYAISFIFEDAEKTLKDEDVDKWMSKLIEQFKSELSAEIR
jgi:phenylalanyl-tRNA synthetase beta chain